MAHASFFKDRGDYYAMGDRWAVNVGANITHPACVHIVNNVSRIAATLLGHDGSTCILKAIAQEKIDSAGKIDIKHNYFIGHGAIAMPNITIGPNAVVAGVPARAIDTVDQLI